MNTKKILISILSVLFSMYAFAADIVCKGRVVSADDLEPFIGVTIKVENTNSWVCSDLNGNFTITAPEGSNLVSSGRQPTRDMMTLRLHSLI
ncbi:MAG: hypothetical protein HDR47_03760 [Bacteroides sp.]|nr:hypothetical protein [Bacteroides sp.]